MNYELLNVLTFLLVGIAFVIVVVEVVSRFLRPRIRSSEEPAKEETYECGEPAMGSSWVRFDIRFYTVALIFLIFDVEVAFLYPWALLMKTLTAWKLGGFALIEVLLFLLILGAGFVYCWAKGDLDWVKSTKSQGFPLHRLPRPAASLEEAERVEALARGEAPPADRGTTREEVGAGA